MFQGHLVQQFSEIQTLPRESRGTVTLSFLHSTVFPFKGWAGVLGAEGLCADVRGGRLWENMWPRSVYTGTLSSRLPRSMLGSSTRSPSPKSMLKFVRFEVLAVVVDFCPIDITEGGQ